MGCWVSGIIMISIYFVRSPILSGVQDLSWTFIESGVQDLSWTSTYSLAPPLALGCLLGAFFNEYFYVEDIFKAANLEGVECK